MHACRFRAPRLRSLKLPSDALACMLSLGVGFTLTALTCVDLTSAEDDDARYCVTPRGAAVALTWLATLPALASLYFPKVHQLPEVLVVAGSGVHAQLPQVRRRLLNTRWCSVIISFRCNNRFNARCCRSRRRVSGVTHTWWLCSVSNSRSTRVCVAFPLRA